MNDPISRRLPEMQAAPQQGAKVTLPSISHVASMARAGPFGRPGPERLERPEPVLAARSADAHAPAAFASPPPPAVGALGALGARGSSPSPPRDTPPRASAALHQPLKPKGRAYSSTAAAGVPPALAVARRRNSSGAAAAPRPAARARSKSSSLSARAKQRAQSFTYGEPGAAAGGAASGKPLNTHSPIAVAAAAAVTSDKISRLLATQGPLPIRHITSHLSATIPGFGELSLSKQRRLIIAVLDSPRADFVKVGWGRWAVRGHTTDSATHRESISAQLPDTKPPLSPGLRAVEDSAVFSDSEDESDADDLDDERLGARLEDDEVEGTDEEDWRAMGPASLRQTSPREQDAIAALVQLRSE